MIADSMPDDVICHVLPPVPRIRTVAVMWVPILLLLLFWVRAHMKSITDTTQQYDWCTILLYAKQLIDCCIQQNQLRQTIISYAKELIFQHFISVAAAGQYYWTRARTVMWVQAAIYLHCEFLFYWRLLPSKPICRFLSVAIFISFPPSSHCLLRVPFQHSAARGLLVLGRYFSLTRTVKVQHNTVDTIRHTETSSAFKNRPKSQLGLTHYANKSSRWAQ